MTIVFKLKLAIIVMSMFATNSMLQAQYAVCEQDCDPPAKWEWKTVTISLPEWPGCVIYYTFQERTCNSIHEMKGGQITVTMPGCNAQWDWVFEDPRNEEQIMNRIEEIFTQAFQKVSDDYFMTLFNSVPPPANEAFDCNNPPDSRSGGTTTYIRAKCASYCAAQWMQDGRLANQFTIDDCGKGDGCCKITRTYCWDFEKDKMEIKETMETSVGDCDPYQILPSPGCIPEGISIEQLMFRYSSPCKPICEN